MTLVSSSATARAVRPAIRQHLVIRKVSHQTPKTSYVWTSSGSCGIYRRYCQNGRFISSSGANLCLCKLSLARGLRAARGSRVTAPGPSAVAGIIVIAAVMNGPVPSESRPSLPRGICGVTQHIDLRQKVVCGANAGTGSGGGTSIPSLQAGSQDVVILRRDRGERTDDIAWFLSVDRVDFCR